MKRIFVYFLLILISSNCKKEVDEATDPCNCTTAVNCTENYITLVLTVTNTSGQPVDLDDYYTTKISTGEKINLKNAEFDSLRGTMGEYPILADGQKDMTEKCGTDFEFTGIKNGNEIVKRTYKIGHDCCHVKILEGDPNIIISE
ncbi:hypothetical protein L0657_19920 [Dyadobacter sp. CY345]|uniref:hypothetical protein n=1 Tax=Dyadobacter sp. CY345 TaxID=2909335 RepID=UPI001F3DA1DB|nr:hypothetical protein [Dyadobacter sp. CY345]MCF2446235.1 hypothetical protein [Dyadobacter sp. CY345]